MLKNNLEWYITRHTKQGPVQPRDKKNPAGVASYNDGCVYDARVGC